MPSKKPTPTTPLNSNVVQKQQAMHHNQTILQQAQQPQQQFFQTNLVQNNNTYLSAPVMQIVAPVPVEPMFVTVPPRPQRVLHSEAYIKYIEGLHRDSRFITPWEKTIKAQESTVPAMDPTKLPLNWIGQGAKDKPEEVVSALWKLREFMMKDVLQIQHSCLH